MKKNKDGKYYAVKCNSVEQSTEVYTYYGYLPLLKHDNYPLWATTNNGLYYERTQIEDSMFEEVTFKEWRRLCKIDEKSQVVNDVRMVEMSIDQAKEVLTKIPELRDTLRIMFTDEELGIEPVLKDWEDLDFLNTFYPNHFGEIKLQNTSSDIVHLNVPTKKHAKSMIAFAKLSMLMDDLGDECNIGWCDDVNKIKYVIEVYENNITRHCNTTRYQFLAFKTETVRDEFLIKHERLIRDYFMID